MAGRRPKPSALRMIEGNRGKRPVPKHEPQPLVSPPERPAWLWGEAVAEWDRLVEQLIPLGMLTTVDAAILARYCDLHREAVRISAEMQRPEYRPLIEEVDTKMDESGGGAQTIKARPNPLHKMMIEITQQIRLLLVELGLTPAARSRVKAVAKPEPSKFEKFLHG